MLETLLIIITGLVLLPGTLWILQRYKTSSRMARLEEERKTLLLEKQRLEIALMRRKLEILENEEEFEKLKRWLES